MAMMTVTQTIVMATGIASIMPTTVTMIITTTPWEQTITTLLPHPVQYDQQWVTIRLRYRNWHWSSMGTSEAPAHLSWRGWTARNWINMVCLIDVVTPIVFKVTQLMTGWYWRLAAVSFLLAITSQYHHVQNA
jgi:hypothetical protein